MERIIGITFGMIFVVVLLTFFIITNIKFNIKKNNTQSTSLLTETAINNDIENWSKNNQSYFIPATLYKYDKNKVFEVDSILITFKAIIVIEIKSINGKVSGAPSSHKWTKTLKHNSYPITNPITQNDMHIKHITNFVGNSYPIVSLIIFSNIVKEINISNIPNHVVITRHDNLMQNLDKINNILENKISKPETKKIYKQLLLQKHEKSIHAKVHNKVGMKIKGVITKCKQYIKRKKSK